RGPYPRTYLLVEVEQNRMRQRRGDPERALVNYSTLRIIAGLRPVLLDHVAPWQWRALDVVGVDDQDLVRPHGPIGRQLERAEVGAIDIHRALDGQFAGGRGLHDILRDDRIVRAALRQRAEVVLDVARHEPERRLAAGLPGGLHGAVDGGEVEV